MPVDKTLLKMYLFLSGIIILNKQPKCQNPILIHVESMNKMTINLNFLTFLETVVMKNEQLRILTATWGYLEGMRKLIKMEFYKNSIKEGENSNAAEARETLLT